VIILPLHDRLWEYVERASAPAVRLHGA